MNHKSNLVSMRKINGRFNEFARLFPDQIAGFSTELQTMSG
jgi:hypothetical protein